MPAVRDWSELPLSALCLVFAKLDGVVDLMRAGFVCQSWLDAAKVPDLWRSVDMEHLEKKEQDLRAMAKVAVDRSDGRLEVFAGWFVNDALLKYIVQRSPSLKDLRLVRRNYISRNGFNEAITTSTLPELRSLELVGIDLTGQELTAILDNCPRLETLHACNCFDIDEEDALRARCARINTLRLEWDSDYELPSISSIIHYLED